MTKSTQFIISVSFQFIAEVAYECFCFTPEEEKYLCAQSSESEGNMVKLLNVKLIFT